MNLPDETDPQLFVELRDAFGDDALPPIPEPARAFARNAFDWLVLEHRLLTLIDVDAALVRSDGEVLTATFESASGQPPVTIDVSLFRSALTGVVAAADVTSVEIETVGWRRAVDVDDAGRFAADPVDPPLRIWTLTSDGAFQTEWLNG